MSDQDLERMFQLDDEAGPARPIDDQRAAAIVAAAIGGAGFGPGGGGTPAGGGTKLFLVGGAGAIVIAAVAWIALRGGSTPTPADAPIAAVVAPPPIVEPPPPVIEPTLEPAPTPPAPKPPPPRPIVVAPKPEPKAEDLLAEANRERLAHHWHEADELYARVVALPHAPPLKIQTALVASASLHLEHFTDPRGATRRFQQALKLDGILAEDARWGLAEAARANGDAAGERAALDDFIAHHPQSPLAERAKTRRAAL